MRAPDLIAAVEARFARPGARVQVLPSVALELLKLCSDPSPQIAEAVRVVATDPILAAAVLRRCQSAAMPAAMPITSLQMAVARLGLQPVRDLAFELTLNVELFRGSGFPESREQLRKHCLAMAHATGAVGLALGVGQDYAFLAGLLHDLGIAGALWVLGTSKAAVPDVAETWSMINETHPVTGGMIGRSWGLPLPLIEAIEHHHLPFEEQSSASPLIALIVLAEALVAVNGLSFKPSPAFESQDMRWDEGLLDQTPAEVLVSAKRLLRVDESRVGRLQAAVATALSGLH